MTAFVNRLAPLDKYISSWYNDIYEVQEARMLEYSKAAFNKIVNNVKRITYACNVAMQSVMIVYLIYAIVTQAGKMWASIPLLVVCSVYFLFFLITTNGHVAIIQILFRRCKKILLLKILWLRVMCKIY